MESGNLAMFDRTDPDLPTFFGGGAMQPAYEIIYPEEILAKEVARKTRMLNRSTPYPRCVAGCTVTEAWGPDECKIICPEKFEQGQ